MSSSVAGWFVDHLRDCRLTTIILCGEVKLICGGFEVCTEKAECFYGLELGVSCCPNDGGMSNTLISWVSSSAVNLLRTGH